MSGPSSNIAFTRFIVRATNAVLKRTQALPTPTSPAVAAVQNHMLHASRRPSSSSQPRGRSKNNTDFQSMFTLPPADETLALIEHYFSNTGLLFPYIHRESFFDTYRELTLTSCQKVRRSWLGLLNMVLAMSTNTSLATHLTAQQRSAKSEVFFARAMALCEKQIRSGSSLEIGMFLAFVFLKLLLLSRVTNLQQFVISPISLIDESILARNRAIDRDLERTRPCCQGSLSTRSALERRPESISAART